MPTHCPLFMDQLMHISHKNVKLWLTSPTKIWLAGLNKLQWRPDFFAASQKSAYVCSRHAYMVWIPAWFVPDYSRKPHLIWLPTWESECVYFKDSRVNKLHIWCRQVVLNAGIFCPVHASLPVGNVKVSIMYAGGGKGTCVFVCPSLHVCFMGISPFQMTRSLLQIFHAVLNLPLQLFSNVFVPSDSQARSVAVCPVCSVVCLTSARNPFWGSALDWQSLVNIKKWSWIAKFLKIHHLFVVFQHKTMHFIC